MAKRFVDYFIDVDENFSWDRMDDFCIVVYDQKLCRSVGPVKKGETVSRFVINFEYAYIEIFNKRGDSEYKCSFVPILE